VYNSKDSKTVILGDEYDDELRENLMICLKNMGAKIVDENWFIGGSQQIERLEVEMNTHLIVVEAETYIGLSIQGPAKIIENIKAKIELAQT